MKRNNSYHTSLKVAYNLGIHEELVPKYIKDQIPASTINYWKKNISVEQFIGTEIALDIHSNLSTAQQIINQTSTFERRILSTYLRLKVFIIGLFGKDKLMKLFLEHKAEVVNTIERTQNTLS